jgi:hypothetical protein
MRIKWLSNPSEDDYNEKAYVNFVIENVPSKINLLETLEKYDF